MGDIVHASVRPFMINQVSVTLTPHVAQEGDRGLVVVGGSMWFQDRYYTSEGNGLHGEDPLGIHVEGLSESQDSSEDSLEQVCRKGST
ncbi:unnamed protein product [Choristocarpus tenellus]